MKQNRNNDVPFRLTFESKHAEMSLNGATVSVTFSENLTGTPNEIIILTTASLLEKTLETAQKLTVSGTLTAASIKAALPANINASVHYLVGLTLADGTVFDEIQKGSFLSYVS